MTTKTKQSPDGQTIRDMEAYLSSYLSFTDKQYTFVLALWTLATYMWPYFDAFPYMVITSATKRSGKTRLSELLSFAASNARNFAGMTAATLFRSIRDENPTIFIDEAETLSSESADTMRSVLNVGYRKGQTIPRMGKNGVEQWPAYCPKVFILIGDVFDTLRDRSIIITMRRGEAPKRFLYEIAKAEGDDLGKRFAEIAVDSQSPIFEAYMNTTTTLSFLQDRDEEIWMPLFAIASVVCPDRMEELTRAAVDLATMKTADARRHTEIEMREADREARDTEYGERLLADMHECFKRGEKFLFTTTLLTRLFEAPTAPWRRFRGEGLSAIDMSNLLSRFGVQPKLGREGKGRASKNGRGYEAEKVLRALRELGGTEHK